MIDARLAAPAIAAWMAVLVVLLSGQSAEPTNRFTAAANTAGIVLILFLIAAFVVRNATMTGIAITAIAGLVVALLQASALWMGPVADYASASREVTVFGIVQAEPRAQTGPVWQLGPHGVFPLATSAIQVDEIVTHVAVPLEVSCACGVSDVAVGSHVRFVGRLTPSRQPSFAGIVRMDESAIISVIEEPGPIDAGANAIRRDLRLALGGIAAGSASLVSGLSTGDVSLMPPLLEAQMKATGMSHLTAVSGANVAIILACVLGLAALLRMRIRMRVVLSLVAIVAFVVLVRPEPSVVRAAVMGAVVVVSMLSGGRRAGPAVLTVAVLLLVLLAPQLAMSWAFALSVAATLGIIVGSGRIERWLPSRTPPAIALALGITIGAQIATLPVLLLMGVSVSWVSIPANLLAGLAVAPVTVLGLAAALIAPIAMPVAVVLAHVASIPAAFIAGIAGWADGLPAAHIPWPAGVPGIALMISCLVAAPFARRHWRRSFTVITALAVGLLVIDPPGSASWPPKDWILVACEVGQGDALVVRGSSDAVMVVDTGPDVALMASCLRDLGVSHIGALVLTHFHADHVGGLAAALAYRVDQVIVSPVDEPAETYGSAERDLIDQHSQVHVAAPGMKITLPGIDATVLWPASRIEQGSVPNNASVVLNVVAQNARLLLSGDVEREAQARIATMPRQSFDVVKIPHHGSANLDEAFTDWAQAPIAVVSVGLGNDYGHPSQAALDAWPGAILGRTDTDGAVAVVRVNGEFGLVRRG